MSPAPELKATLTLPQTAFSMKANLPQNEPLRLAHRGEHPFQLVQRRLRAPRLAQDPAGVAQSGEDRRRQEFRLGQLQQSGRQRQQVAGEIAAVHRRDVERQQRPRLRVSYQL